MTATPGAQNSRPLARLARAGFDIAPIDGYLGASPSVLDKIALLTEYAVCDACLPARCRALLMLLTTRLLGARSLWDSQVALARRMGLSADTADSIEHMSRPAGLTEVEEATYAAMLQLLLHKRIGTASFRRASGLLDDRSLIDAFGIIGTFACHAFYANAFGRDFSVSFAGARHLRDLSRFPREAEEEGEAPRYRTLRPEELSLHQRQIVEGESWRRIMTVGTGLDGPNGHLIRSAAFAAAFYPFAEYCKCDPVLAPPLREIVIVTTGRIWGTEYVWSAHGPTAIAAGIDRAAMTDIGRGKAPTNLGQLERTAFDVCCELHYDGRLSGGTRHRFVQEFNPVERIDVVSIFGEYVLLSAVLNAYRFPAWAGRMEPMSGPENPFRQG